MKQYLSDPIIIFMSLAVVYLLGFIGVALLCMRYIAELTLPAVSNPDSGLTKPLPGFKPGRYD